MNRQSSLRRAWVPLAVMLGLSMNFSAMGAGQALDLMAPVAGSAPAQAGGAAVDPGAVDRAITRVGSVRLASDTLMPVQPDGGYRMATSVSLNQNHLVFGLFQDVSIDVQVDAEGRPKSDVLSLNGRTATDELSTFSLTITPESYMVTYDDPKNDKRYRIVGDTNTGIGQVTEIDVKLMQPMLDLPPIIPPLE